MKNVLILINNNDGYFPHICNDDKFCCYFEEIYKKKTKINRIVRKIFFKLNLLKDAFFNKAWIEKAITADIIILFDTGNISKIQSYISNKFPHKRLIIWYWNPVERTVTPKFINREKAEIWSFDISDCKKYKFKYNNQFFFIENINKAKKVNTNISNMDCFFSGKQKDRKSQLIALSKEFEKYGLSYYYMIATRNMKVNDPNIKLLRKRIPYVSLLAYAINCKAIIDIVFENQEGLTLRPLEALFLRKKLITNFKKIKQYDFYRKENIFIIGDDDFSKINDFMNLPYNMENHEHYIEKYSVYGWLNRFEI